MKRTCGDATVRAAIAVAVAISAVLITAPSTDAATCMQYAEQPYYNGAINGWGHWWNCSSAAKVMVVLRQDIRWWPDRTLDSGVGYGSSGSLVVGRACGTSFDPIKVFVEVRYGTQRVQSARAILPCG